LQGKEENKEPQVIRVRMVQRVIVDRMDCPEVQDSRGTREREGFQGLLVQRVLREELPREVLWTRVCRDPRDPRVTPVMLDLLEVSACLVTAVNLDFLESREFVGHLDGKELTALQETKALRGYRVFRPLMVHQELMDTLDLRESQDLKVIRDTQYLDLQVHRVYLERMDGRQLKVIRGVLVYQDLLETARKVLEVFQASKDIRETGAFQEPQEEAEYLALLGKKVREVALALVAFLETRVKKATLALTVGQVCRVR